MPVQHIDNLQIAGRFIVRALSMLSAEKRGCARLRSEFRQHGHGDTPSRVTDVAPRLTGADKTDEYSWQSPETAAMGANIHTKIPAEVPDDTDDDWWGLGQLDPVAMAAAGAVVGAVFLAALTVGLLLQEPAPGREIGANLKVLGSYLPGYDVSWFGACVSALYGFVVGVITGFVIAFLWNVLHLVIIRWFLLQKLIFRL